MTSEQIKQITDRIKNKGIVISRVPEQTRNEFREFANKDFADDYGMTLHFVWHKFKELINIQETFDIKLNYIIELLEKEKKGVVEKESIRTMGGTELEGGKK